MHRTAAIEKTLVSEFPNITNEENIIIASGKGKKIVQILSDKCCEEQTFLYSPPKDEFGYNASRDIPIISARYSNQGSLNFNQYFA